LKTLNASLVLGNISLTFSCLVNILHRQDSVTPACDVIRLQRWKNHRAGLLRLNATNLLRMGHAYKVGTTLYIWLVRKKRAKC
jgi:hypothetical protein